MAFSRLILVFLSMFVLALTIGACGALPKPFQRSAAPPGALTWAALNDGVRVALPLGTTKPMAKLIANAVVKALTKREIPASVGLAGKLRYVLNSQVEIGGGATSVAPTRIRWQLTELDSKPFLSFNYDVAGSTWEWEWRSPKVIHEIGEAVARLIADTIAPEDKTLVASQLVTRGVWVKPIKGAPGDGAKSLTRAIRYALIGAKVAVTGKPFAARYFLAGQVALGPVKGAMQAVEIRWTVTYPDGAVVGHAVQRNAVPAGTFDNRWGEDASLIAAAAVGGIKDVLDRAEGTVRARMLMPAPLFWTASPNGPRPKLPPPGLSPEPELPKPPKRLPGS